MRKIRVCKLLTMMFAFAMSSGAQTRTPVALGSGMREIAIRPASSDSDFGRFFRIYQLTCQNGCLVIEVAGRRFDTESDFQRTHAYHDEGQLRSLRTPTESPFHLLILDLSISQPVNTLYDVYFDEWDAKILTDHEGVKYWPIYKSVELVRVSPKDLTDEIRSVGPHDPRAARDLATKSMTLYRRPDQVSTVSAALKEVIDSEINHRVEQARMADRQNDWPKASEILQETLRDIPESSAEITKLGQEYYQQGAAAEAQGNWQDAIKAFRKTLDIMPGDLQATTHMQTAQEKGVGQCLSQVQTLESKTNYQAALELLNQCSTYLPNEAQLGAESTRLRGLQAAEQERVTAALKERAFEDEVNLCTQDLEGHHYPEAVKLISELLDSHSLDSHVANLASRAAQEIPPQFYESHVQAEQVILPSQRVTPSSALKAIPKGTRVDWHGYFARKTIDNWYFIDSPDGSFVFKADPHTLVLTAGQLVRVIGTVQSIERIGTLGSQPVTLVAISPERID